MKYVSILALIFQVSAQEPIVEIKFDGNDKSQSIDIYISPSCLHCGHFLATELDNIIKAGQINITIKLLPTTAKDFFIMKLIQNETTNPKTYYKIYLNFIKRTIATINFINPNRKQLAKYKGSTKDPDMIKYQIIASDFGFSEQKIVNAFPDPKMEGEFEKFVINNYAKNAKVISKIIGSNKLDLPLIVKDGKAYRKLTKALKN